MPVNTIPNHSIPKLTSAFDTQPHPIRLCAFIMLEAGLRVAEVLNLAWVDIAWATHPNAAIQVPRSAAKRNQTRTVPITPTLNHVITDTIQQIYIPLGFGPAHYIAATQPDGPPITARTLERHIAAIGRKAINARITPHTLRHTFATRLLAVSDLRIVQIALGHKRVATTEIYTHPSTDQLTAALHRTNNTT